jgi:hypothetical protein
VPNPTVSSLQMVPNFASLLFWYLFTTSLPPPFLFLGLFLVVHHILVIVPILGWIFLAHTSYSCSHYCLEVTGGLRDNGRHS